MVFPGFRKRDYCSSLRILLDRLRGPYGGLWRKEITSNLIKHYSGGKKAKYNKRRYH